MIWCPLLYKDKNICYNNKKQEYQKLYQFYQSINQCQAMPKRTDKKKSHNNFAIKKTFKM